MKDKKWTLLLDLLYDIVSNSNVYSGITAEKLGKLIKQVEKESNDNPQR